MAESCPPCECWALPHEPHAGFCPMRIAPEPECCNLHRDCAAADAEVRANGGRPARRDGWADGRFVRAGDLVLSAFHCSIDNCEDCFGC